MPAPHIPLPTPRNTGEKPGGAWHGGTRARWGHRTEGGSVAVQQCAAPSAGTVEVVGYQNYPEAMELLERDPVTNVAIASWVQHATAEPSANGAQLWGYRAQGRLSALCFAGANLVPTAAANHELVAFAAQARAWGKRCSSLVGPASAVEVLWQELTAEWGPPREVRPCQPVMLLDQPPLIPPDPRVRLVAPDELDVLLPAAVAMFTEEVGVSPVAGPDRGSVYRRRVYELITSGQAFAWIENGEVLFKAEVGAVGPQVAQIQGVWITPRLRGLGLAAPAMAAVAQTVMSVIAPQVSLYVNDFNTPARAAYRRVGFRDVGLAMTVML